MLARPAFGTGNAIFSELHVVPEKYRVIRREYADPTQILGGGERWRDANPRNVDVF